MKRSLGSCDSLGALMSICPTDEHIHHNHVYSSDFQTMLEGLDEEGCVEESSGGHDNHIPEKKRRLKVEQVKALEKNFEVENKLEPERKVKLAQELGLRPRQVAVWFQNRRARWKTKQLERDYGVLKANYDQLKHNYENIKGENDALLKEIHDLKAKLNDNNGDSKIAVKEETIVSENQKQEALLNTTSTKSDDDGAIEINFESFNNNNNGVLMNGSIFTHDFKDGSSDSDSSAVLNEENQNHSPKATNSSSGIVQNDQKSPQNFLISSSSNGCFQITDQLKSSILEEAQRAYQPQFVKIEEHNFFSCEDSCNTFFCDDQAPTLQWYNSNDWN